MQDSNITTMSGITPSGSLSGQGRAESSYQAKDVFPLMLKDISEKAEELESLGKQCNALINSKKSRLRSLSNTEPEEYKDILYRKGLFLDNLTEVVADVIDHSLEDGPKYTINCYNQCSSLFESRCFESKQDIFEKTELLKEQKLETTRLISQGDIFANLVEEENEQLRHQEHRIASHLFEDAKADLAKVINVCYPNEEEKNKFLSVMAKLVEAHINNLDSVEDQYVEVLQDSFNNPGLRCLMGGFVVVRHPQNPRKLRLSVED